MVIQEVDDLKTDLNEVVDMEDRVLFQYQDAVKTFNSDLVVVRQTIMSIASLAQSGDKDFSPYEDTKDLVSEFRDLKRYTDQHLFEVDMKREQVRDHLSQVQTIILIKPLFDKKEESNPEHTQNTQEDHEEEEDSTEESSISNEMFSRYVNKFKQYEEGIKSSDIQFNSHVLSSGNSPLNYLIFGSAIYGFMMFLSNMKQSQTVSLDQLFSTLNAVKDEGLNIDSLLRSLKSIFESKTEGESEEDIQLEKEEYEEILSKNIDEHKGEAPKQWRFLLWHLRHHPDLGVKLVKKLGRDLIVVFLMGKPLNPNVEKMMRGRLGDQLFSSLLNIDMITLQSASRSNAA